MSVIRNIYTNISPLLRAVPPPPLCPVASSPYPSFCKASVVERSRPVGRHRTFGSPVASARSQTCTHHSASQPARESSEGVTKCDLYNYLGFENKKRFVYKKAVNDVCHITNRTCISILITYSNSFLLKFNEIKRQKIHKKTHCMIQNLICYL